MTPGEFQKKITYPGIAGYESTTSNPPLAEMRIYIKIFAFEKPEDHKTINTTTHCYRNIMRFLGICVCDNYHIEYFFLTKISRI